MRTSCKWHFYNTNLLEICCQDLLAARVLANIEHINDYCLRFSFKMFIKNSFLNKCLMLQPYVMKKVLVIRCKHRFLETITFLGKEYIFSAAAKVIMTICHPLI